MSRDNKQKRHERRFGKPERLIDLALSGTWKLPGWCKTLTELQRQGLMEHKRQVTSDLTKAKVIVADNVCEYFYANNPKEEWHVETDFPCCAPPHDLLFIEMKRPSRILSEGTIVSSAQMPEMWGWLFRFGTTDDLFAKMQDAEYRANTMSGLVSQLNQLRPLIDEHGLVEALKAANVREAVGKLSPLTQSFFMHGMQYKLLQNEPTREQVPKEMGWAAEAELIMSIEGTVCLPATTKLMISKDGKIMMQPVLSIFAGTQLDAPHMQNLVDVFNPMSFPAFLALSFMHCKNTVVKEELPDAKLNRVREKAGLRPFLRYHTIDIEPMKRVLRTEGKSETEGLQRALHICRGHFSTYSEEKPLFGKVAGTFWIPAHVRGAIDKGVVISDYKVNPGVGQT